MATLEDLAAGRIPCEDDAVPHSIDGIHVLVRCACGCLFRSTDATIALGMAQQHVQAQGGE